MKKQNWVNIAYFGLLVSSVVLPIAFRVISFMVPADAGALMGFFVLPLFVITWSLITIMIITASIFTHKLGLLILNSVALLFLGYAMRTPLSELQLTCAWLIYTITAITMMGYRAWFQFIKHYFIK